MPEIADQFRVTLVEALPSVCHGYPRLVVCRFADYPR
jgi:hypothetical protein